MNVCEPLVRRRVRRGEESKWLVRSGNNGSADASNKAALLA